VFYFASHRSLPWHSSSIHRRTVTSANSGAAVFSYELFLLESVLRAANTIDKPIIAGNRNYTVNPASPQRHLSCIFGGISAIMSLST
jgi:hypothetical protein